MQSLNKRPFGKAQAQSASSADSQSVHDRREHPRTTVLQKAKLAFGAADFTLDCVIQNLSAGGASVRIQPGPKIPERLILVHLQERVAYEANVVWRKDDGTLGLKFSARHDLEGTISPGLKTLRRYCIEYSLRTP